MDTSSHAPPRRFGGLFWRLSASYFVATLAAAFIGVYIGRFSGPFGAFRDNPVVLWFNRVGDNSLNGGILFMALAALVGTLTGLAVSFNLRRRLRRITLAADAWSRGDFEAVARDRSGDELGRLARDLNRMAEQVRTLLASRAELAVVEERNRLARELHDTVKQQVFAGALLVRAARTVLPRDPATAQRHLTEAENLATQTQQELIALIRALHPAAIADKGLAAVLRDYTGDWARQTGIAVDLRLQGERATPLAIEEALYRVAQEALANVARHSGARAVVLRLAWDDAALRLSVRDDGAGFDPSRAAGRGLGLASMRERVEALSGSLTLASGPDGTTVEACVPLPPDAFQSAIVPQPAEATHE
ncbi:MAG TPA: sensor histidine kinase [Ktedonobacterales bacterium]|jgi:NarL family two-component system sensor histidine kinase LiaS